MKECIKCGSMKVLTDYPKYKSRTGELMYRNACKECESKYKKEHYKNNKQKYLDKSKQQRESDPISYKKYLKDYYKKNREVLIQKQKQYYNTPKGKEVRKKSYTNYRSSTDGAFKEKTRGVVNKAIKNGLITKPSQCSICKCNTSIEAHHTDYSKPLDIVWLCKQCHENIHHLNEGKKSRSVTVNKPPKRLKRLFKE